MTDIYKTALGILIPFFGTLLGSATVFFLGREMSGGIKKALLGFASGVMSAASVWSLIIPSVEMAKNAGAPAWLPATVGFSAGTAFLLMIDRAAPRIYAHTQDKDASERMRSAMLAFAVTLHNIPEGMAVGVIFAGVLAGGNAVTVTEAMALSIGIAIQNFPEGSIISMPLRSGGMGKGRAFLCGALSGVVEPIGALITVMLTSFISPALPYILSFAAGAMIYVVFGELVPESQEGERGYLGMIGVAVGFCLMMALDIALG